jgi:hypothetical protein
MGSNDMKSTAAILACALLLMPATANATVADLFETLDHGSEQTKDIVLTIVEANVAGLDAANLVLNSQGKAMLYCTPQKISLTGEQLVDILRRFVQAKRAEAPFLDKLRPAEVLLVSLKDAFPCNK